MSVESDIVSIEDQWFKSQSVHVVQVDDDSVESLVCRMIFVPSTLILVLRPRWLVRKL